MRVFIPLAMLGLAATRAAAGTPSSYGEWVKEFPSCAQNCAVQFYNEAFAGACGQNAQSSTMQCICTTKGSLSTIQNDGHKLSSCIASSCSHLTPSQTNKLLHASNQITRICTAYINGNAASSLYFNMPATLGLAGLAGMLLI